MSRYASISFTLIQICRMNDYCLIPNEPFFIYIMARTTYIRWDDNHVRFVLDQRAWLFLVLAHWNNSPREDICRFTWTHYADSESIGCSP